MLDIIRFVLFLQMTAMYIMVSLIVSIDAMSIFYAVILAVWLLYVNFVENPMIFAKKILFSDFIFFFYMILYGCLSIGRLYYA